MSYPSSFQDPAFSEPTRAELGRLHAFLDEEPAVVVAFDTEGARSRMRCLIAAERVEVVPGIVYRYWREDLRPGERLAPWVTPE
ncbi:hypothetical protein FKR81_22005 [Lentzea tibetensis]|uniref:Uncharacterized protein n=1 Tax=Lentzea tibetensis TaxID=2591470 RepID=A0A563EQZ3_9PSEU|nr:hypothetical protein [Lentzea tibetensis]TWP49915.1 hypothetical protein FKR81_22005 [Lentzea tibetensis]